MVIYEIIFTVFSFYLANVIQINVYSKELKIGASLLGFILEHDMMRKVVFKKRTFSRVCVVFDIFSLVSPRGIEVTEWGWKMYPPL